LVIPANSALQHCRVVYRCTSFFLFRAWNSGDLGFAEQETMEVSVEDQ
jgi:hypothetical protein